VCQQKSNTYFSEKSIETRARAFLKEGHEARETKGKGAGFLEGNIQKKLDIAVFF
jgi:hypothetical protein